MPHPRVPAGDLALPAAELPVHPVLLPVRARSGDPPRRAARRLARGAAHRPLPSVPSGRVRSGPLTLVTLSPWTVVHLGDPPDDGHRHRCRRSFSRSRPGGRRSQATAAVTGQRRTRRATSPRPTARASGSDAPTRSRCRAAAPERAEDTVRVTSPLYTYGISTRGAPAGRGDAARATSRWRRVTAGRPRADPVRRAATCSASRSCAGRDTLRLRDWDFTAVGRSLERDGRPGALTLTGGAGRGRRRPHLPFPPDDYQIEVDGRVTGVGPQRRARCWSGWAPRSATPKPTSRRTSAISRWSPSDDETERTRLRRASSRGRARRVAAGPSSGSRSSRSTSSPALFARSTAPGGRHQRRHRAARRRGSGSDPTEARHPRQPAAPAERHVRLLALRRARWSTTGSGPDGSRLRRREPLRLARVPHHHPAVAVPVPLAAGLDAREPAPGLRPGAGRSSASWSGSSSGRSTRRPCVPT